MHNPANNAADQRGAGRNHAAVSRGLDASPTKLEIRNLVKKFGDFDAVNDVSLSVKQGEFLTLLGGSGSGKSTILNIIAGLDYPTSGDVLIDGRSLTRMPPHKRNIGMVFQRYTLFPHMSAEENIAFPLHVRGVAPAERLRRAREALKLVQLEAFGRRMPSQLSGGQQQRVAIARALVYEPEILLMDEPLGALDRKLREEIQDEIRELHSRLDVTIIYVTHDQEEALRMSDTIAVMHNGRILQRGTGEDLYERPASRFIASFVGTSNILEANVISWASGMATVDVEGHEVLALSNHEIRKGGRVWVMFRPERAWIEAIEISASTASKRTNTLPVRLRDYVFLGEMGMTSAEGPGGVSLVIRQVAGQPDSPAFVAHQEANVVWPAHQTLLFTE